MLPIYISIREERPPEVSVRRWRAELAESQHQVGEEWHRNTFPKHFSHSAPATYDYQKRSPLYLIKKRKLALQGKAVDGGQIDNVLTGLTRELMSDLVSVQATPQRVTVHMQAPSYVTLKPNVFRGSTQPDKYAELTRVTEPEQERAASILAKAVKRLDAYRSPKVTVSAPQS
jgi:hypothetical protein